MKEKILGHLSFRLIDNLIDKRHTSQVGLLQELYATLDYMVKVFRKTRRLSSNDGLREIQRLANECMLEHNAKEVMLCCVLKRGYALSLR